MRVSKSFYAAFIFAAFAIVSCKKSSNDLCVANSTMLTVSVEGQIEGLTEGETTKASLSPVIIANWTKGDKVFAYDATNYLGVLEVQQNSSSAVATLAGEINAPAQGCSKIFLVYVHGAQDAPEVVDGRLSVDFSNQTKNYPFVLYSTLNYNDQTSISNVSVLFNYAMSVVQFNCYGLDTEAGIDKVVISGINTKCQLTLYTSSNPIVSGAEEGNITVSGSDAFNSTSDGRVLFKTAVVTSPSNSNRKVTIVMKDNSSYSTSFKSALSASKSYNALYGYSKNPYVDPNLLPGKFTVNDTGKTIQFTKGNLYWDGSEFGIEEHQWDYAVGDFHLETRSFSHDHMDQDVVFHYYYDWLPDHVSHFYWTKNPEDAVKQAYDVVSGSDNDVFFASNGGAIDGYTVLTREEWRCLLNNNMCKNSGDTYLFNVAGVDGFILKPSIFAGTLSDTYSAEEWSDAEASGLVFFPLSGFRLEDAISIKYENQEDYTSIDVMFMWTSTTKEREREFETLRSYLVGMMATEVTVDELRAVRFIGATVRLVSMEPNFDGYFFKSGYEGSTLPE